MFVFSNEKLFFETFFVVACVLFPIWCSDMYINMNQLAYIFSAAVSVHHYVVLRIL